MCLHRSLVAVLAALSLNACASRDTQWRFSGLSGQDRADITAALRKITPSPIVQLQPPLNPPNPDFGDTIYFYTEDKRMYRAQRIRGKWHIIDVTNAIVAIVTDDLTRRSSQPLAVPTSSFSMTSALNPAAKLAAASGG
jgi:hypothetical protein